MKNSSGCINQLLHESWKFPLGYTLFKEHRDFVECPKYIIIIIIITIIITIVITTIIFNIIINTMPEFSDHKQAKFAVATTIPESYCNQFWKKLLLPPQGFRPEAKSRGGTLVTRAYIKDSTYSSNIQSVY